jgi:hypothetical protein
MKQIASNNTNFRCILHGWTIPKHAVYGKINGQEYVLTNFTKGKDSSCLFIHLYIADEWIKGRLYPDESFCSNKYRIVSGLRKYERMECQGQIYQIVSDYIKNFCSVSVEWYKPSLRKQAKKAAIPFGRKISQTEKGYMYPCIRQRSVDGMFLYNFD